MYCKYCGAIIDDDAEFCFKCGKPQHVVRHPNTAQQRHVHKDVRRADPQTGRGTNPRQPVYNQPVSHYDPNMPYNPPPRTPQRNGRHYQKKKKKLRVPIILTVFLIIAVVIIACVFLSNFSDKEIKDAIYTVQNGHLGQYTDFTVKELFDNSYMPRYKQSEWDAGYTDDQVLIVEVKYFNATDDKNATRIQFSMLNEECFKVTAYVDPENPFEKRTDFLLALNYSYFSMYYDTHRDELREVYQVKSWYTALDMIYASDVEYGAGHDFEGNRATLNHLDQSQKLEVSTAMLLDAYGIIEMELVYTPELYDFAEESVEIEETEPKNVQTTVTPTVIETMSAITETEPAVTETMPPATEECTSDISTPVVREEENQLPSGPDESGVNPAYQELTLVLTGIHDFQLDYPDKGQNLYGITDLGGMFCDPPMEPVVFMPVDLDQDGTDEVIVELSVAGEELRYLILRYYNGIVYGYSYTFQGNSIGTDGYIVQQGNDGSYLFQNIWFEGKQIRSDVRVVTDPEGFFLDWELAQWYNFNELY